MCITFKSYKPILYLLSLAALSGCSKSAHEPGKDEILIVGPVKFDENTKDVGVKANKQSLMFKKKDEQVPDFFEDDDKIRKKLYDELNAKKIDRHTPEPDFSAKDYAFLREYEPGKRVMFCEDFPHKNFAKADESSSVYRTECAGIEHFTDGSEGPTGTHFNNYIYNDTRLIYISRAAYYLGDSTINKKLWDDIDDLSHGVMQESARELVAPVDQDVAVVTFQDWGYVYESIIEECHQKESLGKTYGENRVYSPAEGVLVYETVFEANKYSVQYIHDVDRYYYPPNKYYGFVVSINNRISFSGHTEIRMETDDRGEFVFSGYDYTKFDKKVKFYKDYIKKLDYDKLYSLSKAPWQ